MGHLRALAHFMSLTVTLMVKDNEFLGNEAIFDIFGVSRRTILRKISKGDIFPKEIKWEDRKRSIRYGALVRVFGLPASATSTKETNTTEAQVDTSDNVVETLRVQLAKSEEREASAVRRAERLEEELTQARRRIDELTNGIVAHLHIQTVKAVPAKPKGFLGSIFSRFK